MSFGRPVPEDRRCKGVSRSGKPCSTYAMVGESFCSAHHPDSGKRSLVARDPRQAKKLRDQQARERKEQAAEKDELRRLGLKAQTAARAERERERLIEKLFDHAFSSNERISMAAIGVIYDRVLGKPVQQSLNVNAHLEENPLVREFAGLSPDERRAILTSAARAALPAAGSLEERPRFPEGEADDVIDQEDTDADQ